MRQKKPKKILIWLKILKTNKKILVIELKDTEDKLLRSIAELENQRRRFEKEKQEAIEFGGFNFARKFSHFG